MKSIKVRNEAYENIIPKTLKYKAIYKTTRDSLGSIHQLFIPIRVLQEKDNFARKTS